MQKKLLPKMLLLLFAIAASRDCFCQTGPEKWPLSNNRATVKGHSFNKTLYISKDSLKKGFLVELQDPTYKIQSFLLSYFCKGCDFWVKTISRDSVTVKDVPILPDLKKDEGMILSHFKIEKAGKYFTIPEVTLMLTD